MLHFHKLTATALMAFFFMSGIFTPYGSVSPFFSTTDLLESNQKLTKELDLAGNQKGLYRRNEVCLESDLEQRKMIDFGISLSLCSLVAIPFRLSSTKIGTQVEKGVEKLSFCMIAYIHKIDGKKQELAS